jgi:OOP family OmpA-OmpF porin
VPAYTHVSRMVSLLVCVAGLSACTDFSLRELREAQFNGSAFEQALALEYRTLAEDQAALYDWQDSNVFAQKGLAVAYGQTVHPEDPYARDIDPHIAAGMEAARVQLLEATTDEAQQSHPRTLARAWSQYECWVENAEEGWRDSVIASCKENFEQALKEVLAGGVAVPQAENGAAEAAPVVAESGVVQDFYVLLFRLGSSTLNVTGEAKLQEIAASLQGRNDWQVMLNGHTDRSGPADFNMALSERRAQAVKAKLVALGLDASRIQTFAFGETDPAVPTADGAVLEANRRVEILLN